MDGSLWVVSWNLGLETPIEHLGNKQLNNSGNNNFKKTQPYAACLEGCAGRTSKNGTTWRLSFWKQQRDTFVIHYQSEHGATLDDALELWDGAARDRVMEVLPNANEPTTQPTTQPTTNERLERIQTRNWLERIQTKPTNHGRCYGVKATGDRCKVNATVGSGTLARCGHHLTSDTYIASDNVSVETTANEIATVGYTQGTPAAIVDAAQSRMTRLTNWRQDKLNIAQLDSLIAEINESMPALYAFAAIVNDENVAGTDLMATLQRNDTRPVVASDSLQMD